MKIYLVVFEWSTEDDSDVDIEAFDSYEKAANRFNERIQEEKTDMSWVHDAFDENGDILDGYDFDECQPDTRLETYAYWSITKDLFDATAFDKTALCKLDAIFGDKLALR